MVVLAWIGQILLFFVVWKLLHWGTSVFRQSLSGSLFVDLAVNVIVAVLLLIFVHTLTSTWWLMGIIGALVGVITGMAAQRNGPTD